MIGSVNPSSLDSWNRVAVVGPPAAGKSRLAAVLHLAAELPHVQLDHLRWPKDRAACDCEFAAAVSRVTSEERWILEGADVSSAVLAAWQRAEIIVWLDHSVLSIGWRLAVDCYHLLMRHFSPPRGSRLDYLTYQAKKLKRSWNCQRALRRDIPPELAELSSKGVQIVRLRSVRASRHWLRQTVPDSSSGYADWSLWPWRDPTISSRH
jgi:hypothetical protein